MLKFSGCLEGEKFSFIAVDNFNKDVVNNASVFFLSHYHTDHFPGLRACDGRELVEVSNIFKRNPDKVLYCSDITRLLFIKDDCDRIPENQIKDVRVGESIVISGPELDGSDPVLITVTFIPSGHILGAVMFLFEHEDERVLFTGDFRIHRGDTRKLKALHFEDGEVKPITNLYLDTTFCNPTYRTFPTRSEVLSELVLLISDWLSAGCVIHIDLPYKFGYETLILDLGKALKRQIVVDTFTYDSYYAYIPELDGAVCSAYDCHTDNHKIHVFVKKPVRFCEFCSNYKNSNIKVVRPCAMTFTESTLKGGIINRTNSGEVEIIRVAYSTHCSLEELKDFVKYLQPEKVSSIVSHCIESQSVVKEQIHSVLFETSADGESSWERDYKKFKSEIDLAFL